MTLNLIFTHPRAFSLCIMQNVNISITTFFFFIMHAFSIRFLKLLFPIPFNWRSIKLTYRILEVLFIRSGCHFYSSKYFPNQWGQPDLSNLFKRRSGANCLQTCLYPVGQRVYCQWVDVRYLICSQFIIWVLFRQQGTVKRQSPIIIKEMRANRKCWLPGLIYNYEHLLIASSSSQYLTVCHAMLLSLVCTRLSSHWCKKKNETETYNLLILPDDRQYTRSPRNPCCCGIPALHVLHLVKCDCWSLLYWSLTRQQGGQ